MSEHGGNRYGIDVDEFSERYYEVYDKLYNMPENGTELDAYYPALEEGDALISSQDDLVREFVLHRQDPLSSDREVVAFVLTLHEFLGESAGWWEKKQSKQEFNIPIEEFAERFGENYEMIYNAQANGTYVAGYDEAVEAGDAFIKAHPDFVREFAEYRGDVLSSDREVAAFMVTLEAFT